MDLIIKLSFSFGLYVGMNQKDWKFFGIIIVFFYFNGWVMNNLIICFIESDKVRLEELLVLYKEVIGKEFLIILMINERFFQVVFGFYEFRFFEEMVNGICFFYFINVVSVNKSCWDDVDLIEVFLILLKIYSKGFYFYYFVFDDLIGNVIYKIFGME